MMRMPYNCNANDNHHIRSIINTIQTPPLQGFATANCLLLTCLLREWYFHGN
jgi:hypothetical protein